MVFESIASHMMASESVVVDVRLLENRRLYLKRLSHLNGRGKTSLVVDARLPPLVSPVALMNDDYNDVSWLQRLKGYDGGLIGAGYRRLRLVVFGFLKKELPDIVCAPL